MRLLGFEITLKRLPQNLQSISVPNSWWGGPIRESFPGAWQKDITVNTVPNLLASSVVYACVNGIASDIAKNRLMLSQDNAGIWQEIRDPHGNATESLVISVLDQPNHYQNSIQFLQQWMISKLLYGNTYVLKERDERGNVKRLYVLSPQRVTPLQADDGSVYYRLQSDHLSQVEDQVVVPASEIIHDRMTPLFHPLVGIGPMYACAMSATMGAKIQANSTSQFANLSRPGGVLTSPLHISDDTAARMKSQFEANFSGNNFGRLLVAGDGLKFEPMALTAEASQLAEQLDWTVKDVGRAFHYPEWKLGGPVPAYSNGPEAITTQYYVDCLQPHIEDIEKLLEKGLELSDKKYHIEMDLNGLFRMDTRSLFEANSQMVAGMWATPNEARFRANYAPIPGGETAYGQEQQWPLKQLSERPTPADQPKPDPTPPEGPAVEDEPSKAWRLDVQTYKATAARLRERFAS